MRSTLDPADVLPPILSVSDVARLLGASERTIRSWADAGDLPAFKLTHGPRGRWKFRRADVLAIVMGEEANGDGND
jgi:excisionase family DNA binding protein